MKTVLFVVYLDKFAKGFYSFIVNHFFDQKNYFLFYGSKHEFDFLADSDSCFWCDTYKGLSSKHPIIRIANTCDLIIYSGLFKSERCVLKFGLKSLKKTYIHLWGNDFYCLKNIDCEKIKRRINLYFRKYIINKAAGVINLIPGDYKELCAICTPTGNHFVAPMCDNGSTIEIITALREQQKCDSPIMILIGNSATETNQHIQAFSLLEKYKDEEIQIVCPLSYGDEIYRDMVIEAGYKIFGKKFRPIISYMNIEEYYKVISDCRIAIFNNNRQQAMANINTALALNCKVYMRDDTSMWDTYSTERGMEIFNILDIEKLSFEEFIYIPESLKDNYAKYLRYMDLNKKIIAWQSVFNSIE